MRQYEDVAARCETDPPQRLRSAFAVRYRAIIGVPPELRHEYRAALEHVEAGGGMSVTDVRNLLLSRHQANGSTNDDGA